MTTLARPTIDIRRHWPAFIAALLALGGAGWLAFAQLVPGDRGIPPVDSSSSYEVTGVKVDVAGRTAEEARNAGWRLAQRRGWKILWARLHGASPDAAPGLPDSTLDSIVAGIEVEQEQTGPHRYIASLGLLFDRAKTGEMIGSGTSAPRSAPMLVIPVQYGGSGPVTFETRTAWQKAWATFRAGASPVDYVRPVGSGVDPLLLNIGQACRPGRLWWRMLLDQYGASDVVVPEVYLERRFPGGPIAARFVARHGPDDEILGSFSLIAATPDGLDKMLSEGVEKIDAIYVAALGDGRLRPDPSLSIEEPDVPSDDLIPVDSDDPLATVLQNVTATNLTISLDTADSATLDQAQGAIQAVPGVNSSTVSSLALGGTSLLSVSFNGDLAGLKVALAARGWRLDGEGTSLRMRRTGASAPPPASPPPQPIPAPGKP